jgi:ABC-type branched-subunit amino acid transport system substrate-binding protein
MGAARAPGAALRASLALLLLVLLAACGFGPSFSGRPPEAEPQVPQISASGPRVALILPLTGQGDTQRIGTAMKQAAELALFDSGNPGITLITKDTGGTPQGAAAAAQAALGEGAEIILGPLLANEARAVSAAAKARQVPVVAFSTASSVAGPGTYLLSFLPEEEVTNVVRYASEEGLRNLAALVPQSQFGAAVERALANSSKVYGANIVAVERHSGTAPDFDAAARSLAGAVNAGSVQAVLIPEGGEQLRQIGAALQRAGFEPGRVKLLGTGQWDDPQTAFIPIAVGGWYPGVPPELIRRFEERYRQAYGATPPRLASLAYDAVSLAIILARDPAGARFSASKITNPEGFQGINGLFRFRPDGSSERGLAVLQVNPSGAAIIEPAPQRFTAGY